MKRRKDLIILTMMIGLILGACAPVTRAQTTSTEVPTNMPVKTPTDSVVLKNDPQNTTYLIDGQEIALVNGVAEKELAPGSASKQVTRYFGNVIDIDLNSDGLMDSAFLLVQDNGGSGTFYFVAAAIRTQDGYTGTNGIFLGDRIAPQSTTLDPNNSSQFIVNYADRAPNDPMSAQPTLGVSRTFKLENGTVVEVIATPTS